MKRFNILFIVLLGILGFTSCEASKDPVINSAALDGSISFKLNQPRYANYVLEDAISTKDLDSLTCVQPNYGFTAAVTYTTQVCFDSNVNIYVEINLKHKNQVQSNVNSLKDCIFVH